MTGFIVIDAFLAALYGILECIKWMFEGLVFLMTALMIALLIYTAYRKIRRSEK